MDITKEIINEVIDELYKFYETQNMIQTIAYVHPMFYNGTFSENNSYQPPEPEKLLTREEFETKFLESNGKSEWQIPFEVLLGYIMRKK